MSTVGATSNVGGASGASPVAKARLAIFTSHPIQYQAPYFRALADAPDVEPTVFFGSAHGSVAAHDRGFGTSVKWDTPLLEGYRHVMLQNAAVRPDVSRFLGVRLGRGSGIPDLASFDACLVFGWHTLAHLQAIRAAIGARVPLLLRGESTLARRPRDARRAQLRAALWLPVRERLYRRVFAQVAAFLATGTRNAEFYRHFRVPADRIYWAPYCVDNSHFALSSKARLAARFEVRASLGLADSTLVFICAAKLIEQKRPLDVLAAFARCPAAIRERSHLVFVGDGALREAVARAATELGVRARVTITGFVNQSAMPAWYAAGDALILASDTMETWGLVVNEAMAAGLPVVVSDAVGCAPDLVEQGENGLIFPLGDVDALAACMARVAALDERERAEWGACSRRRVADFSIDQLVTATRTAMHDVLQATAR